VPGSTGQEMNAMPGMDMHGMDHGG
jgi:hypothetical protein